MLEGQKTAPLTHRWLVRLFLAVTLLFGSEILLWTNPTGRGVEEWLLLVPGYIAVAAILLDIMRRFNIRDLVGLMIVAGIYGLLNALIINPESTLFDLPRSLVVRAAGAHSLLGLEMLFVFLALTGGHLRHLRRVLLGGSFVVGFAWGTWGRWSPEFADVVYSDITLETLIIAGIIGLGVILLIAFITYWQVRRIYPDDMLLTVREWAVLTPLLMLLLLVRIAQQSVDTTGLVLVTILLLLCMSILWFRRNTEHKIILAYHLPIYPLDLVTMGLTIAIWLWMATFSYSLPLIGNVDINQFAVVVIGFALYGIGWLPAVSLMIGVRNYIRQVQGQPL